MPESHENGRETQDKRNRPEADEPEKTKPPAKPANDPKAAPETAPDVHGDPETPV